MSPRVWALVDERAGTGNQALAVAEALGLPFETRAIAYAPAAALPNVLLGASFAGVGGPSRAGLVPPWPDLAISAGRRAAPVARAIKRMNAGATFVAQVMFPGVGGVDDFDLIATPRHDRLAERRNLVRISGAPHRITAERLADAEAAWRPRLTDLPRPWVALMVGGATRRRRFSAAHARALGYRASQVAATAGGALLVTTSRRTGAAADDLVAAIEAPARVYRWGDAGENPYVGYLACADAVIVTGDSVSMCSEACATSAPVYIHAPAGSVSGKHARLHAELYAAGYARPLGDALEEWTHPPLNAAAEIAAAIRERMGI